ncbi:MAG: heme-binding protein [Betaproteobacteria bacterium]
MSTLSLDVARQLMDHALRRAQQDFGRPICVSVCDPQGFLLAFARMQGAPVRSIQISQGKAYTAARMGVSTAAVLARLQNEGIEIGYFCDPLLTALPGGSALKDESGTLVGAIGVSGLTSAEDQLITDGIAELVRSGAGAVPARGLA